MLTAKDPNPLLNGIGQNIGIQSGIGIQSEFYNNHF